MTYEDIAALVVARASDRLYDTVMGRAFFRAIGVGVREPVRQGVIVRADRFEGIEGCMAQRFGVVM